MKRNNGRISVFAGLCSCLATIVIFAAQDQFTLKSPNGIAFSEFLAMKAKHYTFAGYPAR
jgi:hypothetical protein